jgi:hypothetical protein
MAVYLTEEGEENWGEPRGDYLISFPSLVRLELSLIYGGSMDDKTMTAVSTSLALMQIQLNALLLLLDQQHPTAGVRDHFQGLVSEGVATVGLQTMEGIKSQIREAMRQQEQTEPGSNQKGHA